nr:MAG TPA: hypothetical protein [Caudoviricetes sp.]
MKNSRHENAGHLAVCSIRKCLPFPKSRGIIEDRGNCTGIRFGWCSGDPRVQGDAVQRSEGNAPGS